MLNMLHRKRCCAMNGLHLSKGEAGIVGFGITECLRAGKERRSIELGTKAELKAGLEKLLRQLWLSAKTVNDAHASGRTFLMQAEQFSPATHTMDDERKLTICGQLHLAPEVGFLLRQRGATTMVQAAFAHGLHLRQLHQGIKSEKGPFPIALEKRMNADRIDGSRDEAALLGMEQPLHGYIHNGPASRRQQMVCMAIHVVKW